MSPEKANTQLCVSPRTWQFGHVWQPFPMQDDEHSGHSSDCRASAAFHTPLAFSDPWHNQQILCPVGAVSPSTSQRRAALVPVYTIGDTHHDESSTDAMDEDAQTPIFRPFSHQIGPSDHHHLAALSGQHAGVPPLDRDPKWRLNADHKADMVEAGARPAGHGVETCECKKRKLEPEGLDGTEQQRRFRGWTLGSAAEKSFGNGGGPGLRVNR